MIPNIMQRDMRRGGDNPHVPLPSVPGPKYAPIPRAPVPHVPLPSVPGPKCAPGPKCVPAPCIHADKRVPLPFVPPPPRPSVTLHQHVNDKDDPHETLKKVRQVRYVDTYPEDLSVFNDGDLVAVLSTGRTYFVLANGDAEEGGPSASLVPFTPVGAADPSKADKAVPAAAGNLAALNAFGNLVDSGAKPADFASAGTVAALVGGDSGKSARAIASEEAAAAAQAIVGAGTPEAFDTLKEIADWIADDQSGAAKIVSDVSALRSGKVDKETGKGLSTNDFTDAEKRKLAGIAAGATAVTVDSALSGSSTNPVENRAVSEALAGKFDKADEDLEVSLDDENMGLKVADYADLYHVVLHIQGIIANWADGNDKNFLFPRHPPSNRTTLALLQNIAPDFSTSASYAVDDLCVRSGQLFRCTAAHAPDDWNFDHFQLATVQDVLASLCSVVAARPTKAALDAGWWSWTVMRDGVDVTSQVAQPVWDAEWNVSESIVSGDVAPSGPSGGEDTPVLSWTAEYPGPDDMETAHYTATRHRVAGPTPTKTSDLQNDGDGTSPFAKVSQLPTVPVDVSAFANDAGYVTSEELEEAIVGAIDDAASMDDAKADKAVPSAAGNLASLAADGNLADSGKRPSDFAPSSNIQKAALASDVQASLGLADSALQVHQELVYEDGSWHADSLLDDEEHDVRVVEVVSGPTYHDGYWTAQFLYNNGVTQQLAVSGSEDATELRFGPNGTTAVFSRVPAGYVLREPTRSRSRSAAEPAKVQPAGFYADRSEMSVTAGTGEDADKATIQLKEGVSATVLTQHQDISGKANASDVAVLETAVAAKADKDYVDGLFNYKAITASLSITASSPSLGSGESQTVREKGRTVTAATFHYVFNKVPVEAKFGTANPPTEAVDNPALSGDIAKTGMLVTSATTWRISGKEAATPGKTQQTATASVTINFYNGVYYGVAAIPGTLDSAFILGLANKSLRSGKLTSFTVNAGAGQYIWYALPASMGACAFKVGGFDGGFTLADTIQFTNSVGHAESYRVYRSDNPSLGSTTVNVS